MKNLAIFFCLIFFASQTKAAPGELDPLFDSDGYKTLSIGQGRSQGTATAIQADGKILIAGFSYGDSSRQLISMCRFNSDGSKDIAFDIDGCLELDFPLTDVDRAQALLVQPDGKIILLGDSTVISSNSSRILMARFNVDGSLDPTFGIGGKLSTRYPGDDLTFANAFAIQSDLKLVVVGNTRIAYNTGPIDLFVARFNIDGTPDNTFDTDGFLRTDLSNIDSANAVDIQTDGKIVVSGELQIINGGSPTQNGLVLRYLTNGALDPTFEDNPTNSPGYALMLTGNYGYATSVLVEPDRSILAAGTYTGLSGDQEYLVNRFNSNGVLSAGGFAHTRVSTVAGTHDFCKAMKRQTDGKIVLAGYSHFPGRNFSAVRMNSDLTLDTTFSGDGKVRTEFEPGSYDEGQSIAIQADGNIIVGGGTQGNSGINFGLVRYRAINGGLDSSFDLDGKVFAYTGGGPSNFRAVAVQTDGKIVAVGTADISIGTTGFLVARFDRSGALDTTFSSDGYTITNIGGNGGGAAAVAIQTDGKIVVTGTCVSALCAARYKTSGDLDPTFSPGGFPAGTIWINPGNFTYSGNGIAVQPSGRIIIAAGRKTSSPSGLERSQLWAFDATGAMDGTFAGGGISEISTGSFNQGFRAIKLQADGKILAVADGLEDTTEDFCVVRFDSNGNVDNSFDGDGKAFVDFGLADSVNAVDIQTDGKILLTGKARVGTRTVLATARLLSNGSPDFAFGVNSKVTTTIGSTNDVANAIRVQPSGKIIVAGYAQNPEADLVSVRYNSNGTLDSSIWGTSGVSITDLGAGDETNGIVFSFNGNLLAVGKSAGNAVVAQFRDLGPSAAMASISGRVITTNGTGIKNALITLSNSAGATRTAISNSFGYYRFDDIEAGKTYVINASSKRFEFSNPTRVLDVSEDLNEVDFTVRESSITKQWLVLRLNRE